MQSVRKEGQTSVNRVIPFLRSILRLFSWLKHQQIPSRIFSQFTSNDRGLIVYGVGVGKSCVISAITEDFVDRYENFDKY